MKSNCIELPQEVGKISLRFLDMNGRVREIIIPTDMLDIAAKDGIGFDSSNLGYTDVSKSDMVAIPDIDSLRILQDGDEKLAVFICDLNWPDGRPFTGDPRRMLKKTLKDMDERGFAFHIKPEYEFYLLDSSTMEPVDDAGYIDGKSHASSITNAISREVFKLDIPIQKIHHEVGRGQYEIEPRPYEDTLKAADDHIFIKEIVKGTAEEHGAVATFMPKPSFTEPGSGMHVHITLLKDGKFISLKDSNNEMRGFIGGLLNHAKALTAICCPTVNSYKRLVPGYEAPVYIVWGGDNRSVLVRVPSYGNAEEEKGRAEFRAGDASGNFYLMLNSLLVAGMDGVDNEMDPGHHMEEDLFEMDPEEISKLGIEMLPENLGEALVCLENDTLLKESMGELYEHYMVLKRREWRKFNSAVTDWEFTEYLDC